MAYKSFTIRSSSDNNVVDLEDIDFLVRKEFSLQDDEFYKPYGCFSFTEDEEELDGFQKLISWPGLIHTIVYYSKINYGKSSVYDLEAAMAWVKEHAIDFPHSAIVFTSKLAAFLQQRDMYVFVNFHRDEDRNEHEYVNTYNSYKILRNESGVFECDNDGKLLRFYPETQNLLDETKVKEAYTFGKSFFKPCVHSLIIPEGVTAIREGFFSEGFVKDTILFPNTLCSIGNRADYNVFAGSRLPDIIIPDKVNMIGTFAFGNSIIKSVRFSRVFECEYLRQFKGAYIETLYLPHECRLQWEKGFDGYAYLHEVKKVEFY